MRLGDEFFDRLFQRDVAAPAFGVDIHGAQFFDGLIELGAGAGAQREFGALAAVVHGDGFADAAAAAGDQCDFVFEFHWEPL